MTEFRHGTLNGFLLGKCGCRACSAAMAQRLLKPLPSRLVIMCCETEAFEDEGAGHDFGCPGPEVRPQ